MLILLAACHTVERPIPLRSAELHIVVDDTAGGFDGLRDGGEVVQSEAWRENGHLRASVLLRVPQGELMRTLAAIRGEATSITAERVTERWPCGAGVPPAVTPASRRRPKPTANSLIPPSADSSGRTASSFRDLQNL